MWGHILYYNWPFYILWTRTHFRSPRPFGRLHTNWNAKMTKKKKTKYSRCRFFILLKTCSSLLTQPNRSQATVWYWSKRNHFSVKAPCGVQRVPWCWRRRTACPPGWSGSSCSGGLCRSPGWAAGCTADRPASCSPSGRRLGRWRQREPSGVSVTSVRL